MINRTIVAASLLAVLVAATAAAQTSTTNDRPPPRQEGFVERGGYADALRLLGDDYRIPRPATTDPSPITIVDLEADPVYAPSGDVVGRVDKIVLAADGERYLVFDHGGTLGFDERTVALPLERFVMRGDDLYVRGVTEEDIAAMPGVVQRWEDYPALEVEGPLGIDRDETEITPEMLE
jgi:hypothetical protein